MADTDKSLDILIRILTEQVGAQKADEILAAVKKESVNVTDATADLTEQTEKQAESTSKLTGLHRELRSALVAIAGQSPVTGASLGSVFLGPVGAIIGAIALFREAKTALDDYNKSLDEHAASAAQSFDDSYQHMQSAVEDLIKVHAKMVTALGAADKDKDPIATSIKNRTELYNQQFEAIKRIIEAQDKASGMTKEQIDADLAELDHKKEQHARNQIVTEYLQRDAAQTDLEKKSAAAQKTQADANTKLLNQETERSRLQGETLKLQKTANDAAEKLQSTPKQIAAGGDQFTPATIIENPAYGAAQAALQRSQDDAKRNQDRLKQLDKKEEQLQTAKAQADADAEEAQRASIQNKTRLGELGRQIPQSEALASGATATGTESTSISIARLLAGGASVPQEQATFLRETAELISGRSVTLSEAVKVMATAAQNHAALAEQVNRLTPILARMDPSATTRLQAEIDRIDRELFYTNTRVDNHGP